MLAWPIAGFLLAGMPTATASPFIAPVTKTPEELIDNSDPYQANAIVTGYDMRSRPTGFAQCLREVLVKLSGEPRLEHDPRIAELATRADRYVASFDYADMMAGIPVHDDQGTYDRPYDLVTRFDHAKVDQALAGLGERPWLAKRPQVVPVLAVRGFTGHYLLSNEVKAGVEQRASLSEAALKYGLSVRVPTEAELASWGVGLEGMPSPSTQAADGQALVAGTLVFDEAKPGWVGSWRMRWQGTDYSWGVSGVNYDEAFRTLMRGVMRIASGHGVPD
jgi:hypothetical protein